MGSSVSRASRLSCFAVLVLVACSDPAPPPASAAPVARPSSAPAPVASVVPSTDTPRPEAARVAPPARRTADTVRASRARLAEARRLAHAGDAAGAWTIFAELIAASSRSPQLRCEGGYVAQRAGQIELAEEHLDAGLAMLGPPDAVSPALRVTAATCLYNRGLVYELRGAPSEARRVYRASLALRPNAVVQRHLDALPAAETSAGPVAASGASALAASLAASACDLDACIDPDDDTCRGAAEVLRDAPAASWLRLTCPGPDPDGTTTDALLALRGAAGFAVFDAATAWDGGRYYGASSVERVEASEVLAFGEADARWTSSTLTMQTRFGHDYVELDPPEGVDTTIECYATGSSSTSETTFVLCRDTCRGLVVAHRDETAPEEIACSDDGDDVPAPGWARPAPDQSGTPTFEVAVDVSTLGAQLRVALGAPPDALRALTGRIVPFDALFAAMTPLEGIAPGGDDKP